MVKKLILISLALFIAGRSSGCTILNSRISNHKLHLGEIHANKRQYEKAESDLIGAILHNPRNAEAWVLLGDIHFTIENYEAARHAYQEALRFNKNAFEAYAGLWKVRLEEAGYTEEVRKEVKKEIEDLISLEDKRPERLMAAYYGLQFLHEDNETIGVAKEIMASGPDEETGADLSREISEILLIEKDLEKRLKMAEDFLRTFPDSKERYVVQSIRLKIVAKDLKDRERLYQYGEDWIREEPDNRRANFIVGFYYTEEDVALEKAITYLRRALSLIDNPDPADRPEHYPESEWRKDLQKAKGTYYDTLGWAYYKLGRFKDAERAYRRAVKYLDFDQSLYYHLGLLLEEEGNIEEAIRSYVHALKSGESKEAEERLAMLISSRDRRDIPVPPSLSHEGREIPLYRLFAQKEGVTTFTDVTEETGLSGVKANRIAWGDYNNNGYEDILFNGAVLVKNNGDGTFRDVTKEAGITEIPSANGGVWGDFDNDGHLDFYTFASGKGTTDRLWKNKGDGTFMDVTVTALKVPDGDPTEAAALGDYDNDGFLDIYIANYEKPLFQTVGRAICRPDRLFHNAGEWTFTDVSAPAGVVSLENMCGRGVNWGDYDNDGDLDIYVSNYRLDPNFLWRNNGDGTFTNVATEVGLEGSEEEGAYGHTIGAEWGDINNDGHLDLFVSNLAHPRYIGFSDKSMLLVNQGPSDFRFVNRFGDSGIRFEETSADPSLADYDNDGILDLYFASTYGGRKSFLYKGDGDGTFTDITWLAGVRVDNGWGNAFADYDKDGDLDLLVASSDGVRLFRNNGNRNHWLHVRVVGRESNRAGIGTRVTVKPHEASGSRRNGPLDLSMKQEAEVFANTPELEAEAHSSLTNLEIGNQESAVRGIQIREVQGGKGTGSQHSLPVEFGFGNYSGPVDIEVRFPSGMVSRLIGVKTDQMILVEE